MNARYNTPIKITFRNYKFLKIKVDYKNYQKLCGYNQHNQNGNIDDIAFLRIVFFFQFLHSLLTYL